MSEFEKLEVQLQIEQIINRSRHHDEMFFTDSKTAANEILNLLKKKNFLVTKEMRSGSFEMSNN